MLRAVLLRHDQLYLLILRSGVFAASRRMKARPGPHGSPGDAKHRPETALTRLLTMRDKRRGRIAGPIIAGAPGC